jgi:HAMP domain-containing protein
VMFGLAMTSIRQKVMAVTLIVTMVALLVAGLAMAVNDWNRYRESLTAQLNNTAEIISRVSIPSLSFDDRKTAWENLAVLSGAPSIRAAALYTAKGELFASYLAEGEKSALPKLPSGDGLHTEGTSLVLYKRIVDNNEILGTLYLQMHNDQVTHVLSSLGILAVVMLIAMLAAYLLSKLLQQSVTGPVLSVAEVAQRVVASRDFSLRAPVTSQDETGALVVAFNSMLDEIGNRAVELEAFNQKLEKEIGERRSVQDALLQSESRSRALVSAIAAVTWVTDNKGAWHGECAAGFPCG